MGLKILSHNLVSKQQDSGVANRDLLLQEHVFLQRLLATCADTIYVCDVETRRAKFRNRPLYLDLGYSLEEVDAPDAVIPSQFMVPEDRIDVNELFKKIELLPLGKFIDVHFRMRHKLGNELHYRTRISPLDIDASGFVRHFIGIITDITEQKRAETIALNEKKIAESASAAKTRFLGNLSHELRTPLHILTGALDLMDKKMAPNEEQKLMTMSQAAVKQLKILIDDALDLACIEARRVKVSCKPFAISDLTNKLLVMLNAQPKHQGVKTHLIVDKTLPEFVAGDIARIQQIVGNFLSNAGKFTKHGAITLRAEKLEQNKDQVFIRLAVEDTGPGIDLANRSFIFERFNRGFGGDNKEVPGSGLGLAIAKELSALMGGKVGLVTKVGQGSTFFFEIPLAISSKPDTSAFSNLEVSKKITQKFAAKILIVDDNKDNLRIAEAMLQALGCLTTTCQSGAEALEVLPKVKPDLVLLDYRMQHLNGIEVLQNMRERGMETPVFFLTANPCHELNEMIGRSGVKEVLAKPLRLKDLRGSLQKHFQDHITSLA